MEKVPEAANTQRQESWPRPDTNSSRTQTEDTLRPTTPVEDALNAEGPSPSEAKPPKEPEVEPPPNGGLNAWMQVAGSFFLFFNCWVRHHRCDK